MGAGDLLVRIGAVTFIVGALGTLATVAPLLLDTRRLPTPAYFVSMLMGVGLAVALCGLLKAALAQRQGAAEAVAVREGAELS
jgi:nitrate/nitrite transporter NarK